MSIATEITALDTNLNAAKEAVEAKGGTVGDTGLSGLAAEIATIPSGGAVFGTVTYVDGEDVEHTVNIQNPDELHSLCTMDNTNVTIGGETFRNRNIVRVDLGSEAYYLKDNFLYGCNKLTTVTGVENVYFVGNYFLRNCSTLDCELNFTNLEGSIGSQFLAGCYALNHTITLGSKITELGTNFMQDCRGFTQNFTVPSNITTIGTGFMRGCNNFTGNLVCATSTHPSDNNALSTTSATAAMYTTGVTLTGTYASDWKTALADRDSSPYRKLILGS